MKLDLSTAAMRLCFALLLFLAAAGCGGPDGNDLVAQESLQANLPHPFLHRLPAPPLEGGSGWFNTPAQNPLKLESLRGKFVLLDFWTYCCINCIHVLPELKKLERAYPQELVVVGVHSAKFEGERVSENIREAVMRYEIEHPVVNDGEMRIWQRYGIRSWPTMVLIDPQGKVVWIASGEQKFEDLRAILEKGLPYYREQGLLASTPLRLELESEKGVDHPLRYPGKILVTEADADSGGRLFIADSNHNRIVVTDLEGRLQQVIGSGSVGHEDGPLEECSFHHPQGMALVGDLLYVADTENHLLRKVNLSNRQVTTIAGTGEQGRGWPRRSEPLATPLSSPWAVWAGENDLYIAMAGPHQIWRMPLDESKIAPYAGNGREDIVDGPLFSPTPYAMGYASFAQPSGLTSDGGRLFVADSEGSAIRSLPIESKKQGSKKQESEKRVSGEQVETIVGPTGTLFDFGDIDGIGSVARLQHPLGIAHHHGKLYVADTYNNKIKVIDLDTRSCQTLAGTGQAGSQDSTHGRQATFNEPTGLTAAEGKLYVADTNSHAIRVIELTGDHAVSTLEIEGLSSP